MIEAGETTGAGRGRGRRRRLRTGVDDVHSTHGAAGIVEEPLLIEVDVTRRARLAIELVNDVAYHGPGVVAVSRDPPLGQVVELSRLEDAEVIQVLLDDEDQSAERGHDDGEDSGEHDVRGSASNADGGEKEREREKKKGRRWLETSRKGRCAHSITTKTDLSGRTPGRRRIAGAQRICEGGEGPLHPPAGGPRSIQPIATANRQDEATLRSVFPASGPTLERQKIPLATAQQVTAPRAPGFLTTAVSVAPNTATREKKPTQKHALTWRPPFRA